jgi:hypothetical protein
MGGIHVANRKSNAHNFNAAGSKLQLPASTDIAGIPNGSSGYGSVVPEFFHGMYENTGTYGLDAGMFYANGVYRLFVNSRTDGWAEDTTTTFSATGTVTLNTFFVTSGSTKYLRVEVVGKRFCDFYVSNAAYNSLNAGCYIHRELNIATNPSGTYTILPKNAYFRNAKFTETTMTTTAGAYVTMNGSTSTFVYSEPHPDTDPGGESHYSRDCDAKQSSAPSGSFIQDTASCTFNKGIYPI